MNDLPDVLMFPPHTIVRCGAIDELLCGCAGFGNRGLLVHGGSLARGGRLKSIIDGCPDELSLATWEHPGGEPTLDHLSELLAFSKEQGTQWIAAVGGGSVLDVAKACAGLLEAPLPPADYHDGAEIPASRIPFIAAPTTAGTGSESTIVSVLIDEAKGVKKSIRHPSFMPRLVILDGDLLSGCPATVIAASGMDALTQAIESYISRNATWVTDSFALRGMNLVAGSLSSVYRGDQGQPALDLLTGSYLAGIALSNARLGLVHGLAHPLGVRYHAPHGLVCAVCLPPVLSFNRQIIGDKYDRMGEVLGGDPVERASELLKELGVGSPFKGQLPIDFEGIVKEALASGSTAANPRDVTASDIEAILAGLF